MPIMQQIAELMRTLGFKRTGYNELVNDTSVCLVALFKGTGYEKL